MRVIGLTGGIGAGKSTVAESLHRRGAVIIDADEIARDLLSPSSPWVSRVAEEFGPKILHDDGSLCRARLADLIFSDAAARARLNAICHPPIISCVTHMIEKLHTSASPPPVVIVVAPLLFEANAESTVEKVIVVVADDRQRLRRLKERDGLDEEEVLARFSAQLLPAEQRARADWTINNSGSLSDTEQQIETVWKELVLQ